MSEFLINTANGKAPWQYFEKEIDRDDLIHIANEFPDSAMRETGIGDLSIIRAYEKYKERITGVGNIRNWSLDEHLACYKEEMQQRKRRKTK